uniref:Phosphate transporter PHO1 n=2 Tax=Kalanchoe fedtschenkoi TaxID=63787 RepID=A0A7N0V554_KALFE
MVKFSKQLEAQLIPEWKDAFVNYWQLKKHVRKIKVLHKPKLNARNAHDFGLSIFDPVLSAFSRLSARLATGPDPVQARAENEASGDEHVTSEADEESQNENELVLLVSEEDEVKSFFDQLDEELNKVNNFYAAKEKEFVERGDILSKQLQILLDLKQVLHDHKKSGNSTSLNSRSSSARQSDFSESGDDLNGTLESQTEEVITALARNGVNFVGSEAARKKGRPRTTSMRIEIPATTPTRTITAVTSMLWEDLVNNPKKEGPGEQINKKKIQCAEKMIRGAFVELYRGLGLLKTYSSLNMVAFTKIIKKFDKVANQQASSSYLKMVKRSHFISSDKVVKLMDEVEFIFTKHFASNDRKKAMKFLRPQEHKESHMVTFFVGLFTGCFMTLFSVYAILAHMSEMLSPVTGTGYMETVYPVFSMFALLSLHLFMYGCNLFMWKRKRISYNFIFEFQPNTALKYRDAFLICTSLMSAVVGALVIHLILRSNGFSASQVDAIPGVLLLIFMAILICPFNIFYRSTRYCFIRVIRNIVFSPLYKVLMVDFFMADQLTSQIPLLRHMESTACYFLSGSLRTHQFNTCKSGKLYRELAYVISFAPYYWRAMQCGRRWVDEHDPNHLANLGKYVSAMVAAGARISYSTNPSTVWFITVLVTSLAATVYQLYWDFVKDWGLLNPKSHNLWLRDDLILKNKSIYYVSIVFNVVLRVAWVETVLNFRVGLVESRLLEFLLASLEVIRRGHWNFYRIENEHLNNVGKFRAVKTVPLPFRETDSDG